MCTYIGSDLVLANLFGYNEEAKKGVDSLMIERYCFFIKQKLKAEPENNIKYIYFQTTETEFDKSLNRYPQYFKKFMNRYYANELFFAEFKGVKNFDVQICDKVMNIMKSAAESLKSDPE